MNKWYFGKYDEVKKETAHKKETKIIYILADRTRINQIVSNLLNNAIKFTKEGTIKILIKKKMMRKKCLFVLKMLAVG
ncbi:MAG: hypothetical protein M3Z01_01260 [Thermoproteota archaeon]|nr:hypothetical protein [Thermoproteota archaeon]